VAKAFLNKSPSQYEVIHINFNKLDARAVNLRWVNRKENVEHSSKNRISRIRRVTQITRDGKEIHFTSVKSAATSVHVTYSALNFAILYGGNCAGSKWVADDPTVSHTINPNSLDGEIWKGIVTVEKMPELEGVQVSNYERVKSKYGCLLKHRPTFMVMRLLI